MGSLEILSRVSLPSKAPPLGIQEEVFPTCVFGYLFAELVVGVLWPPWIRQISTYVH